MDPFLYVQEEFDNVKRALDESLRYDYGPGQTADYYDECRFRLSGIAYELERLKSLGSRAVSPVVSQLWDLANRLTLIERSHLGEFSWPFADAIRGIAASLLLEDRGLEDESQPIIHMIAEGTSYQISSEQVMGFNKRRRLHTVAFPRQLRHHVLMHALFGHELGHATFYLSRTNGLFHSGEPLSVVLSRILRREGPLRDVASTMAWLRSEQAPELVHRRMARSTATISEANLDHWMVELICDLFGLAIFGPPFAAAHRTYLEPSSRTAYEIDLEKISHPAYALRREILAGAFDTLGWSTPVSDETEAATRQAEQALVEYVCADRDPWAEVFTREQLCDAMSAIAEHFAVTGTSFARRPDAKKLAFLVHRIADHLPPIWEEIDPEGVPATHSVRLEEQLYAGWTYWLARQQLDPAPLTFHQLNQLCDLALLQQQAIDLSTGKREL